MSPQGILGGVTRPLRQMLGISAISPAVTGTARRAEREPQPRHPTVTPGCGQIPLGRAGPAAWVTAYEEVLGFAFWPDDYGAQFRSRGFDVIADTISGRLDRMPSPTRVATTGTARNDGGNDVSADAMHRCAERR